VRKIQVRHLTAMTSFIAKWGGNHQTSMQGGGEKNGPERRFMTFHKRKGGNGGTVRVQALKAKEERGLQDKGPSRVDGCVTSTILKLPSYSYEGGAVGKRTWG